MKRVVIYLFAAIIIIVVTIVLTNKYMNDSAVEEANRINELQVNSACDYLDAKINLWERSTLGFLIGEMNLATNDSISYGSLDPIAHEHPRFEGKARITIRKEDVPWLRRTMFDDLRNILSINHQISSVAFLTEPGVFTRAGWGPMATRGDSTHYDLIDRYDYLHSNSYNAVKRTGKVMWNKPSKRSGQRGKLMMYQIPVYSVTGTFAGVFEIDVDVNQLRKALIGSLPYDTEGSSTTIVDDKGNIILSTDDFYQQFDNIRSLTHSLLHDYSSTLVSTNVHHCDVWSNAGENYFVYRDSLKHAPWQVITICKEHNVYAAVNKTKTVVLLAAAVGMSLVFLCLFLIFRQMRTNFLQKAAAEEELKMAAQVQMSMLKPHNLTTSPPHRLTAFMRPAKQAGGDLYDYAEQDGKLIFCIGDVSGKGMPAALFMTQVVSLFRNAIRQTLEPAQIVSQMNDVLASDNPKLTFCTFFVGVISNGEMHFCNAGHNQPILIYPENYKAGKPESAKSHGSPIPGRSRARFLNVRPNLALGLMEGYPYRQETISLPAASKLVCYTDGVTEAMNKSHQQYGEERLLTLLNNDYENINDAIIDSVTQFVAGAEQSDDITIVCAWGADS